MSGGAGMATWKCTSCGYEKEGRCKPKKCPQCGKSEFAKAEEKDEGKKK
jgi:rubrerythrin